MSKETLTWLNQNTLIGFTAKRGEAWHYRASEQGDESNHYPGAIPADDVRRRLFSWTPVEGDLTSTFVTPDGVTTITDPTRKTIIRPDTATILGVFRQGFQVHGYDLWLIKNLEALLDDDVQIGSAVLLKGGAVAAVQVELSDTISTPEGVDFRPFLSSATSLDGSLASTYCVGSQVIVCDNTLHAAHREGGASQVKIRHSKNSMGRIGEVRESLGILIAEADDFSASVAELCATVVTDRQWGQFLDAHVSLDDAKTKAPKVGRAKTNATNKRDLLGSLYATDPRVAPWKGTAFGVLQAVNTYAHHEGIVRNMTRPERNMLATVEGDWRRLGQDVMSTLDRVLAR